jgi:hypothetical protein
MIFIVLVSFRKLHPSCTEAAELSPAMNLKKSYHNYRTLGFLSCDFFSKPEDTNSLSYSFHGTTLNSSSAAFDSSSINNLQSLIWSILYNKKASSSIILAMQITKNAETSTKGLTEISVPIEGEVAVDVGIFPSICVKERESQQPCIWECVGCLCDKVVLNIFLSDHMLDDSSPLLNNNNVRCFESCVSLLYNGLQRRRKLTENSTDHSVVQLILNVIAISNTDEKQPKQQQMDLEEAINVLQRVIHEQHRKQNYSSSFQLDLLTLVTNITQPEHSSGSILTDDSENNRVSAVVPKWITSCLSVTDHINNTQRELHQQPVPFGLFSTLANQIYSSLQISDCNTLSQGLDFHGRTPNSGSSNLSHRKSQHISFLRTKFFHGMENKSLAYMSTPRDVNSHRNATLREHRNRVDTIQLFQKLLVETNSMLQRLEQKQVALATNGMPVLEFGRDLEDILQHAMNIILSDGQRTQRTVLTSMHQYILSERVQELFAQQMTLLREYYGTQYQRFVEDVVQTLGSENTNDKMNPHELMAKEAKRITDKFCVAAKHSIPKICQPGGILYVDSAVTNSDPVGNKLYLTYLDAMAGFIEDLQHITSQFLEDEESSAEDTDIDIEEEDIFLTNESNKIKKWYRKLSSNLKQYSKKKKWFKKVANKVIAIGINYIQSVLALQALRRAAAERDRNMPKFPLF